MLQAKFVNLQILGGDVSGIVEACDSHSQVRVLSDFGSMLLSVVQHLGHFMTRPERMSLFLDSKMTSVTTVYARSQACSDPDEEYSKGPA